MFFASETAKSTRNECQAMLGVHFDYDLVVGCVRTCPDKVTIPSRLTFVPAILYFRLKSHGVYAIINTS
jgi:hypothetical protein